MTRCRTVITMPFNTRRVDREDQNSKGEHITSDGEAFSYDLLKKETTGESQNQISHYAASRIISGKRRQRNNRFNRVMEQ